MTTTTASTIDTTVPRTFVPLTPGIDAHLILDVMRSFQQHDRRWFASADNGDVLKRCADSVALLARGLGEAARLASAAPGTALVFSDDELYAAVPLDTAATEKLIAELRA